MTHRTVKKEAKTAVNGNGSCEKLGRTEKYYLTERKVWYYQSPFRKRTFQTFENCIHPFFFFSPNSKSQSFPENFRITRRRKSIHGRDSCRDINRQINSLPFPRNRASDQPLVWANLSGCNWLMRRSERGGKEPRCRHTKKKVGAVENWLAKVTPFIISS